MTPTNVLLDAIATRIAADAGTLAHATTPCKLHLAKNSFTPGGGRVVADFTEADFDGYAEIDCEVGAQQFFIDPLTGRRVIQMKEPLGGWHWETTGVTNLNQTIQGFYLTDNAGTVLYGCARLPESVELSGVNQAVDIGVIRFEIVLDAIV